MNWFLLWSIGSFVFLLGYLSGVLLSRAGAGGVEVETSEKNTRTVVALASRRKA